MMTVTVTGISAVAEESVNISSWQSSELFTSSHYQHDHDAGVHCGQHKGWTLCIPSQQGTSVSQSLNQSIGRIMALAASHSSLSTRPSFGGSRNFGERGEGGPNGQKSRPEWPRRGVVLGRRSESWGQVQCPSPPRGFWERCKLPQQGPGPSPVNWRGFLQFQQSGWLFWPL